jgi:nitroreductase/predicted transcriptional regulator
MQIKTLEEIGLSEPEARIYMTLLEIGQSNAEVIIKNIKLDESVFNLEVEKLINRGLVSVKKNGASVIYEASNPVAILKYLKMKEQEMKLLFPELKEFNDSAPSFDNILERRHSTREFSDKKPDWRDVVIALDSAQKIPLANNFNNLKYVLVEDRDTIDAMADAAQQPWIRDVHMVVVVGGDETHLEKHYGERGRIYSKQQSGAAIMAFLLKLTELGLDSCWVGAYDDDKIRSLIRAPGNITIEAIIPIGHEKKARFEKKARKRELTRSIYWEVWERGRRAPIFMEPAMRKDPWR